MHLANRRGPPTFRSLFLTLDLCLNVVSSMGASESPTFVSVYLMPHSSEADPDTPGACTIFESRSAYVRDAKFTRETVIIQAPGTLGINEQVRPACSLTIDQVYGWNGLARQLRGLIGSAYGCTSDAAREARM